MLFKDIEKNGIPGVTRFGESFQIHYLSSLAAVHAFFCRSFVSNSAVVKEIRLSSVALSVWCMKKVQIMMAI